VLSIGNYCTDRDFALKVNYKKSGQRKRNIACPAAFTCAAVMVFAFHDQDSIVPIRFFRVHLRSRGVSCVYRFQETEGYIESSRCAVCVLFLSGISLCREQTHKHTCTFRSRQTQSNTHTTFFKCVCERRRNKRDGIWSEVFIADTINSHLDLCAGNQQVAAVY
jgi:hypothetical protein